MTAEAIEILIELVRELEFIYNAKHENHMDATMLANVWEICELPICELKFTQHLQSVIETIFRKKCLSQNIIFSTVAWHLWVMADKLINSLLCTQTFKIVTV